MKEFKSTLVLYNKFLSFFFIALFSFNYSITYAAFQPTKYNLLSDSRLQLDALNRLIDGLQQKYSRMNGIAAHFVQLYQGADGRTLRESGQVILKRPGKARWEYTSPEKKLFISDGKNIYFYVYGEPQATKSSIKE